MEFLVFWVMTTAASFVMEIMNELRMFKDVADNQYKVDIKKFSELGNQLNPNATKVTLLSMFIPLVNLLQVLKRTKEYNDARPMILDQLNVMGVLDEMSEIEKMEYLKNPTGLNALIVPLKSEIRLSKAITIKFRDYDEESEIYYEMGESLDDITILKVSGPVSKLSLTEQKKKVLDSWNTVLQSGIQKYGEAERFFDALRNDRNMDLNDNIEVKKDEENNVKVLSVSEQKKELEDLKKQLLESKEVVQFDQSFEESILSKRKK